MQHYLGDPLIFPNAAEIKKMILAYMAEARPEAYMLDVAVCRMDNGEETVPLEVHPFVSCGLYSYVPDKLADMLEAGYKWYLQKEGVDCDVCE